MKRSQTHLILNGMSRQADANASKVIASLATHGIDVTTVHTVNQHTNIVSICSTILKAHPTLVIIAGGDGTVSNVLSRLAGKGVEIGIIPLGTTNNFARSLGLPTSLDDACQAIADYKAQPVDLGVVNGHHFANVVGLGLSTAIAHDVSDAFKKRFGRLAYALVGLRQLFTHRAFTVSVSDKDKELSFDFETHQVIIANGRYHAGKQIAQDVAVNNRELVIFALGGRGWLSFIWHTLDFYIGRRKKIIHGSYVVGSNVTLLTSRAQITEVDGEPGPKTPLELQVDPKAVMVRYSL